jgi:hypothetical protein
MPTPELTAEQMERLEKYVANADDLGPCDALDYTRIAIQTMPALLAAAKERDALRSRLNEAIESERVGFSHTGRQYNEGRLDALRDFRSSLARAALAPNHPETPDSSRLPETPR